MNPTYQGVRFPNWYTDKYFATMPEVTGEELASSTIPCAISGGLIVVKPVGDRTLEVLVNNNGKRREFTPRQLVDFLTTCKKKGDSVSIEAGLVSTLIREELERELKRIFGEDGYLLSSARTPEKDYLKSVLPEKKPTP